MSIIERTLDISLSINIREQLPLGDGASLAPFLLVHGLASNAQTWDAVGRELAQAGHHVVAIDQRGHGKSDKPDGGYDFDTITDDLRKIIDALGWEKPILAGQSWGGNVMLAFAARHPQIAQRFVWVDGGTIDLGSRYQSWEVVSAELRPPHFLGTPRADMKKRIASFHPNWSDAGVEATMANFATYPDGTVGPNLALENHLQILRALWEQRPDELFRQVQEPVLICPAVGDDPNDPKRKRVEYVCSQLNSAEIVWFEHAAHDIHVDRPSDLAAAMLSVLEA